MPHPNMPETLDYRIAAAGRDKLRINSLFRHGRVEMGGVDTVAVAPQKYGCECTIRCRADLQTRPVTKTPFPVKASRIFSSAFFLSARVVNACPSLLLDNPGAPPVQDCSINAVMHNLPHQQ